MSKAEQFIKDYTRDCSNELCAVEDRYGKKVISYHEWLTPEQALAALKIARKEVIEKACEWLENHNDYQRVLDNGRGVRFDMTQCVTDFRKAQWRNKL